MADHLGKSETEICRFSLEGGLTVKIMVSGLLILMSWCFDAGAQVPFFQGKTIRIVVGYPAGSTHDSWARSSVHT